MPEPIEVTNYFFRWLSSFTELELERILRDFVQPTVRHWVSFGKGFGSFAPFWTRDSLSRRGIRDNTTGDYDSAISCTTWQPLGGRDGPTHAESRRSSPTTRSLSFTITRTRNVSTAKGHHESAQQQCNKTISHGILTLVFLNDFPINLTRLWCDSFARPFLMYDARLPRKPSLALGRIKASYQVNNPTSKNPVAFGPL